MSTLPARLLLAVPFLTLSVLFAAPQEGSARGPGCTDGYLECLNDALDGGMAAEGGDLSDELGSIECAAGWAGCVIRRFRGG